MVHVLKCGFFSLVYIVVCTIKSIDYNVYYAVN